MSNSKYHNGSIYCKILKHSASFSLNGKMVTYSTLDFRRFVIRFLSEKPRQGRWCMGSYEGDYMVWSILQYIFDTPNVHIHHVTRAEKKKACREERGLIACEYSPLSSQQASGLLHFWTVAGNRAFSWLWSSFLGFGHFLSFKKGEHTQYVSFLVVFTFKTSWQF